jgi:predicted ribosomally synthesized peptide with SipW-like signal peptide
MERASLRAVIVLGVLVTLLGGTGIFAVFSDRATTGSNDVTSGQLGHAADLQIATATSQNGTIVCDTYSDDLAATTGFFSLTDLQPSAGDSYRGYFCLKNVGSSAVNLTASTINLSDLDSACTGDEAAFGDTSCGVGAGELSTVLMAAIAELDCVTGAYAGQTGSASLLALESPVGLPVGGIVGRQAGDLNSGQTACYFVELRYPDSTSAADVQLAQSDSVTWRFAFDATVPSN